MEIRDLTVCFDSEGGESRALDGISFSLGRGSTLGIVGESGSGKSVTALAIMRLLLEPPAKVSGGSILLRDTGGVTTNILSLDRKAIRSVRGNRISMIFQEPMTSLNPVMKCGHQVMEAILEHQDISKNQARELVLRHFREVKLPRPEEAFNAYPHELSGGQKQRVMIAMAISLQPEVLIADEPTTALDVTVQKAILGLMKDLQQKYSLSIIFITHDLALVSGVAERLVVMRGGRIVEEGAVREIFSDPKEPYTRGLIACRPDPRAQLRRLPTIADFIRDETSGLVGGLREKRSVKSEEKEREGVYKQKPFLSIERITTRFPLRKRSFFAKRSFFTAVDDVTLDVYPGEVVGLVGESGCGKTTLGRTVIRLVEPSSGRVLFRGNILNEMKTREMRKSRKNLQIIFQDPYSSLNPRKTIGSAIEEPMRFHRIGKGPAERKQRVMRLLERVGLEKNHYFRYPHEFSGGQRQRICIARALAVEPDFIICDESVSALDVSVQAQVLNLLNDLKEEYGLTYIFISHDLSVVKYMADRIVVMKEGRIEEIGPSEEVYHNPKSPYTRELINAIPKL